MNEREARELLGAWAAIALCAGATPAWAQGSITPAALPVPEPAGTDFPALRGLCDSRATQVSGGPSPTDPIPLTPTRVFDNLYFVGSRSVSSWAITTSRGIILIDALRNEEEARAVIEPAMRSLGLDPAEIRYIIVTHAHGDHYGGVRYLVERYRPRVVMSEIDWRELERPQLQFDAPFWGRPPARDMAVRDGDRLRLGDTSIELRVSRTHTPGTISPIFQVTDGRVRHTMLLWGGTGFNFGADIERLESYAASAERIARRARARRVDVLVSNHPRPDGSALRMETLKRRAVGDPHPFVIGTARVTGVLAAMAVCARAHVGWIDGERRGGTGYTR